MTWLFFRPIHLPVYSKEVWYRITEALDRMAIRAGSASVTTKFGDHHEVEARELLARSDFFRDSAEPPADISFNGKGHFSFTSHFNSRWVVNNVVRGRLFRLGPDWRERPAVILLHGWNGEMAYDRQFPFLAWRLNRRGLNAAMLQLPFHGERRPSGRGVINNFISHDLLSILEATRQSLIDVQAIAAWLRRQGCPRVGLWGISLGAWLTGLLLCQDTNISFGALMTPVPDVETAIRELDFCAPIRAALGAGEVDVSSLNLASLRPLVPPESILIIEARHDLFAPVNAVEHLWNAWNQPAIWRVNHGHISVLLSVPIMERTVRWLSQTAARQGLEKSVH